MDFKKVQQLFPSEDGNKQQQLELLGYIEQLLSGIDSKKDPNKSTLGPIQEKSDNLYKEIVENAATPNSGINMEEIVNKLIALSDGHPYHTRNFVTNVLPMASIPGIIGLLTTSILNGNNLWDVYGPAAAEAEVKVISMMSKLVGYDYTKSWGYTTWGGQGAVFSGLRLAIAKQFPNAKEEGVPNNLYCFASENAHYSLLKSVEATGIGSNHLIRVKAGSDFAMDITDLQEKMEAVIQKGGIPIYVVATTGTTDSFGIDDVKSIKEITTELEKKHQLKPIHIHADSALGGFYSLFANYDFTNNPLNFEKDVLEGLMQINERMQYISIADSLCFDFQKLGQTPYLTSLFLVKNGESLGLLDLEEFETPYVGNRGYGSYHTGYTLECSRMGSSIAIYAALLAFGVEGYQQILANYVRVNIAFRKMLKERIPNMGITNEKNIGPITTFRIYQDTVQWDLEQSGQATTEQINLTNELNYELFEILGQQREDVFFGDTKKQCLVDVSDSDERLPIYVSKLFSISPYTEVEHLDHMITAIEKSIMKMEGMKVEVTL
ncbi:pyridoxal-dependent decarboxylase [Niallia taxi]|uniref:Aspartate aminotransferase family protein n=1 Tax=Niallia taxi TaxID=2499688 RepID=A0A437K8I6_9BACI|nr:pyridoxal-dependent decarboxylase [Niallia taxi]MCM3213382.1 pyridoxal-dependent decarboxylase [Niallia taxi]MDK8640602.1 pyridoxal-dependent decarboxylase [Niallia taxi]MED4036064.1 pyridoxal-dependent decarboxylase [Niallia taxi]RVT60293.1 aspartate aminotransferase family protein [Niallia taxi]